ncbi:MAG: DUF5666 domain-containing protein [Candidatus Thiodiazotropha sp.]|uniref:DUF5666 domain-containing protein n=1 Tax=Candidatus Thiodiazotropha taylori TaxID=2792791 RepID=A0A944M5W1_9GAMM|nr:hypothetical protein [Candidatus Thiodiazotropha taylori]MBV2136745.1 hypothetical protein [Candidatus Thiodiazotropha taylori]
MFRKKMYQLLTIVLVVPLISCGGSSVELSYDGPTINLPDFTPGTASPTAVVSIGPIAAHSGLTVNSVVYDTNNATITINGEPGVVDDLRTGYVVAVHGMLDAGWKSGTAERIAFNANVIGPVEGTDPVGRRLAVMGQRVQIGADTRIEPPLDSDALFNLTNGTPVQVSGLPKVDGEIVATHVQIESNLENVQVVGEISDLDYAAMSFRINELSVDYGSTLIMDLPGGAPNEGMVVIARGSLEGSGVLQVSELMSHVDTSEFVTGSLVQLTGFIARYNPGVQLFVNSLDIETAFHTIFHNGLFYDLSLGIKVEIDGRWGIGNRVTAEQLWFLN